MKSLFTIILIGIVPLLALAQCIEDSHSSFEGQGWVSCTKSLSDIPDRGEAHWIKYDFGHVYKLTHMDIWNHNTWGETHAGAKTIMIDYSLDNSTWSSIGPISVEQAPGSWKYTGMQDVSLECIECRYLILTVVENWDESVACTGFSEVRFNIDICIDTEDEELASAILYPNPASTRITLEHEQLHTAVNISIINTIGQLVMDVPVTNTNKLSIPVADLEEGLYYLSLTTERETITRAFVKQ